MAKLPWKEKLATSLNSGPNVNYSLQSSSVLRLCFYHHHLQSHSLLNRQKEKEQMAKENGQAASFRRQANPKWQKGWMLLNKPLNAVLDCTFLFPWSHLTTPMWFLCCFSKSLSKILFQTKTAMHWRLWKSYSDGNSHSFHGLFICTPWCPQRTLQGVDLYHGWEGWLPSPPPPCIMTHWMERLRGGLWASKMTSILNAQ